MDLIDALKSLASATMADWSPEAEERRIASLPGAIGSRVRRRVELLAYLVGEGDAGIAAVDGVAVELGVRRRNVYVLLDRLRRMPPLEAVAVRGASSSPWAPDRRMGGGDGDASVVDAAVRDLLVRRPDAGLAEFVEAVTAASAAAGRRAPVAKTVARRVDVLRGTQDTGKAGLCSHILLDEAVIMLAVASASGPRVTSMGMVVDVSSGAILSWGLASLRDGGPATASAASGLAGEERALRERWPIAAVARSATLVLPEGVDPDHAGDRAERVAVVRTGPRKSGTRLRRVVGEGVGSIRFRPRHDPRITELPSDAGPGWTVVEPRMVPIVVDRAVAEHNARAALRLCGEPRAGDGVRHDALDATLELIGGVAPGLIELRKRARSGRGLPPTP